MFADLSRRDQFHLATMVKNIVRYPDAKMIVAEGIRGPSFFILLNGQARVTRNENPRKILAILEPGSIFGEVAFLTNTPRTSNVIAQGGDVVVMEINRDLLCKLEPAVRDHIKDYLMALLAGRVNRLNMLVAKYVPVEDQQAEPGN